MKILQDLASNSDSQVNRLFIPGTAMKLRVLKSIALTQSVFKATNNRQTLNNSYIYKLIPEERNGSRNTPSQLVRWLDHNSTFSSIYNTTQNDDIIEDYGINTSKQNTYSFGNPISVTPMIVMNIINLLDSNSINYSKKNVKIILII